MLKRKKRIDADDPLKELERTFRRLDTDQGPVARRNARAAVFAELRRIKTWVDSTYPIKTTRKPKRKPKTVRQLEREGWTVVSKIHAEIAEAGIKPKTIRETDEKGKKHKITLLPTWVVELLGRPDCTVTMLKKARRYIGYRKEMLMEHRFRKRQAEGRSPLGLIQGGKSA